MASATGDGSVFSQPSAGPLSPKRSSHTPRGGELPVPSLTTNLDMELLQKLFRT